MPSEFQHDNPPPQIDASNRPFWEGARNETLTLLCCASCGRFRYPAVPVCKACLSMEGEWKPVSGRARIWSWVVYHRAYFAESKPPYRVAIVELAEGPLMATNIVDAEDADLAVGAPVEVVFKHMKDYTLPVFRLARN